MFAYCGIVFWFPTLIMMRGHSAVNSYWYTLLITIVQIPGYYLAAWLVEKIGRKVVISIFSVGIAVGAILFAVTTQKNILLFSGLLASFFSLGSWGIIQVYTAEQYPVFSRATAMGLACGFSQVGGALATMLVGNLIKMNWSVIMIFSLFLVALLITNLIVISLKDDTDPQKEV
jgi:putative MFS transporter